MRSAFAAFLRGFVLPFGATSGERMFFDGTNGEIVFYNSAGNEYMVLGRPVQILRFRAPTFALTTDPGVDQMSAIGVAGTTRRVVWTLQGPEVTSGARSFIRFRSESEDHTLPPVIELGSFDGGLAGVRGPRIVIPSSAALDRPMGLATLAAGTVTVTNALCDVGTTRIFLSRQEQGTSPGHLSVTVAAGSFDIDSSDAADDAEIAYLILNTVS
jgi:hypothetical protein